MYAHNGLHIPGEARHLKTAGERREEKTEGSKREKEGAEERGRVIWKRGQRFSWALIRVIRIREQRETFMRSGTMVNNSSQFTFTLLLVYKERASKQPASKAFKIRTDPFFFPFWSVHNESSNKIQMNNCHQRLPEVEYKWGRFYSGPTLEDPQWI